MVEILSKSSCISSLISSSKLVNLWFLHVPANISKPIPLFLNPCLESLGFSSGSTGDAAGTSRDLLGALIAGSSSSACVLSPVKLGVPNGMLGEGSPRASGKPSDLLPASSCLPRCHGSSWHIAMPVNNEMFRSARSAASATT